MISTIVPSACCAKVHSTMFESGNDHSIAIRLLGSIVFTSTSVSAPYISHRQRTRWPASSLPLALVNQNLVVTAGSMKALKHAAAGARMRRLVLTRGGLESASVIAAAPGF